MGRPMFLGSLAVASVMLALPWLLQSDTPTGLMTCRAMGGGALTRADLPSLSEMLSQDLTEAPVKGASASTALYVSDFKSGWIRGFIATSSLSGPFRDDLDVRAAALHYPKQRWPYVPLVGDIVSHSNEVLEVYETFTTYTSQSAARAWIENLRQGKLSAAAQQISGLQMPAGTVALTNILGPDDGEHERDIELLVPFDRSVLRLNIQGPPHISYLHQATAIASTAIKHINQVCQRTTDTSQFGSRGG